MKILKLSITTFFLFASFWISILIFAKGFAHEGLQYSVDNANENTFMVLLVCTLLSAINVFFMGCLSLFTHFVFVKLIYSNEIKQGAIFLLKQKRKKGQHIVQKEEEPLSKEDTELLTQLED